MIWISYRRKSKKEKKLGQLSSWKEIAFYEMTFYKQFQNDFPTYIIKIVRENSLSLCAHQHLWKLSHGSGSVKQVVYLDLVFECYDMAFSQYSTKWNLPNKKELFPTKNSLKFFQIQSRRTWKIEGGMRWCTFITRTIVLHTTVSRRSTSGNSSSTCHYGLFESSNATKLCLKEEKLSPI